MANTTVQEYYEYSALTASAAVKASQGMLGGILVSSITASPTIKVWDSLSASGTVIAHSFVPTAAKAYPMPCKFSTGLYVEITGTCSLTVFYQ